MQSRRRRGQQIKPNRLRETCCPSVGTEPSFRSHRPPLLQCVVSSSPHKTPAGKQFWLFFRTHIRHFLFGLKKCLAPSHPTVKEPCHRQLPPPSVSVGDCACWSAGGIKVRQSATTTTTHSTVTTTTTTAGWCWASRPSGGRAGCATRDGWPRKNTSDSRTWCRPSPPNHASQR